MTSAIPRRVERAARRAILADVNDTQRTGQGASAGLSTPTGQDGWQAYPGERLGLPESGKGSVAGQGRKLAALLIDLIVAGLIASLFMRAGYTDTSAMLRQNYLGVGVWYVITVIGHGFFGATPGIALLGMRVVRMDGTQMVGVPRAALRSLLILPIIPACVWNSDHRGLHDRAVGTIVLSAR